MSHPVTSNEFKHSATIAIQDITLQTALDRGTTNSVNARIRVMAETTDAAALRQQARMARLRALSSLPDMLEEFEANITSRGAKVLWAETAEECNQHVLNITRQHDVHKIVKAKSMVSEEVGLNHALEAAGLQVVETDLGEFVVQIAHDTPSHIIAPIIHMTKEQVNDLLVQHIDMPSTDDPRKMTAAARAHLRQEFLTADMGMSGGNFLIAETGTVVTVTNEGNGRMCTSVPRVHVALVGIEKVIPTLKDFATLVQLIARSATGQRMSVYTHMMNGPARPGDPDGPESMYVILLDNGRSRIHAGDYAEALACIRCGACLNVCPVYQNVGGHSYGWVYPGPIGAVVTPLLVGIHNASPLPHASSLCGACKAACPVDINLPDMLLKLRADLVKEGDTDPAITVGIKGWAAAMESSRLFEFGGAAASIGTRILAQGNDKLTSLPGLLGNWTQNRDFPPFASKSFHQMWRERRENKTGGSRDQ